jgi:hypothetical protein
VIRDTVSAIGEDWPVQPGVRIGFLRAEPSPFRGSVKIVYSTRTRTGVRVNVYTSSGRLIRTLSGASRGRAVGALVWDGRDESERVAEPGVYYAVPDGDTRETLKLVKAR